MSEAPEAINHIDIGEFRDSGYLQEANRTFFHPLGLALEWTSEVTYEQLVAILEDSPYVLDATAWKALFYVLERLGLNEPHLSGVWDYRRDPEGMNYSEGVIDPQKAARVQEERLAKASVRQRSLGYVVQPVP